MRKAENKAVEELLSKLDAVGWSSGSIAPAEWKQAFEAATTFPYHSSAERLRDLETVVHVGFGALSEHQLWDECIELAEWASSDAQFAAESREMTTAHFYKAKALISQGQEHSALIYYLSQIRSMPKGSQRRFAFLLGRHLFIALKPGRYNPEPEDEEKPVPEEVMQFARELVGAPYPDRKLPVVLREGESRSPNWKQVHKALSSF